MEPRAATLIRHIKEILAKEIQVGWEFDELCEVAIGLYHMALRVVRAGKP